MVRKLKTLKKQKMDEAKLRGQAETRLQAMRKEKSKLEAQLETQKSTLESASKLLEQATALHETCVQADEAIKGLSDKKKDHITVPAFDAADYEALQAEESKK